MAEATINCRICSLRHASRTAVIWCQNCSEGLCGSCQEHHSLSKGSANHNTIPIADYQKLPRDVLKITDICPEHDEKYIVYCQNHLQPCCITCSLEKHKTCKDVAKLKDFIENYKSSAALQDLEISMKESIENLMKVKSNRKDNLKEIEADGKKALDEIDNIRRKINKHLDVLQDNIKAELIQKEGDTRNTIVDAMSFLTKEETVMNNNLQTLINVKSYATDLQAFLYSAKMERQVHAVENRLLGLIKDQSCSESKINIKIEPSLKRFTDQIKRIGTVEISTTPSTVVMSRRKEGEAQLMISRPPTRQIEDINLTVDKTIDNVSSNCYGCCVLTNGRMAFTDCRRNEINIVNTNGTKKVTINTPDYPFDVTQVNDTTLAVTFLGSNRGIHLIDLHSRKITKSLLTGHLICGITTYDDDHLIYCEYRIGVRMICISDGTVTDIVKEKLPPNTYVTSFGEMVIYTNWETDTVSCYDIRGTKKWEFKNESVLRSPCGLSTDRDGNIYITGHRSGNIVILSANGQKHKEIKCGPKDMYALDYDKNNENLLVVDYHCGKAVVMKQI